MQEIFVVHPDGHTSAELIPGARDGSTLTHRQPGAMGGDPHGADIPPAPPQAAQIRAINSGTMAAAAE